MELLNPAAKGATTSAVTMTYWLLAFVSTKTFEDIGNVEWIGWHGAYWGFAAVCLAGIAFIAVVIPETKGRTSAEIQKHFGGGVEGVGVGRLGQQREELENCDCDSN
jgi:hypothetical protein